MKNSLRSLVILVCCVSAAPASESFLPVSADSKVYEAHPATTYGAEEFYTVWGGPVIIQDEKALLYFNGVDELHLAGMVCEYAQLRLYVTSLVAPAAAEIFKAADAWDEMTVCWNNRPGEDHAIEVTEDIPGSQDVWFEVDVSDIVKSWINDGDPHNGFYVGISEDNTTAGGCQFASREFPDTSRRPRLFIEYYPASGIDQAREDIFTLDVSATSGGYADISFSLAAAGSATLKVYDASGALVETLMDGTVNSGTHGAHWDGTPGVYFITLESSGFRKTRKKVLIN